MKNNSKRKNITRSRSESRHSIMLPKIAKNLFTNDSYIYRLGELRERGDLIIGGKRIC